MIKVAYCLCLFLHFIKYTIKTYVFVLLAEKVKLVELLKRHQKIYLLILIVQIIKNQCTVKLSSKSAHTKPFLLERILLFAKLKADFCFRIKHNSHTPRCFLFSVVTVFIKLDNYGEFRSGLAYDQALARRVVSAEGSVEVKVRNSSHLYLDELE